MKLIKLVPFAGVSIVLGTAILSAIGQAPAAAQPSDGPWVPVKTIDFSSKHDVLILNPDGTLIPMDQPYYTSKKIAAGTWQIMGDGDYCYLVEGDKEAIMIDGGYGAGDIREYAQSLTKKPLRYIANTHSHGDHTSNDAYFDLAYMSEGTKEHLPKPGVPPKGVPFPMNFPIQVIDEGYKFQLGNRELEAIMLGNHAVGSTAYLDRKARILYSGDDIMGQQGVAIHVSIEQFAKMMEKLEAHRSEYDTICAGWEILDATWVDKYLALAKSILAGHEGVLASQAPPAPLPDGWPTTLAPTDPQGRTVYIRHVPHGAGVVPPGGVPGLGQAPASGGPGGAAANDNIMRATLDGATVTYDRNKIKD